MASVAPRSVSRLSPQAYKWVKTWHLLFVTLWLGSAGALIAGQIWLRVLPTVPPLWVLDTLNVIDWFVLVPGASGVVLTGLIFSWKTQWGWGKEYYWIRAKWIIALLGVIVGTFFLAPWLHELIELARSEAGAKTPQYAGLSNWLFLWAWLQTLSLLYAVYLSVFKPKTFCPEKPKATASKG